METWKDIKDFEGIYQVSNSGRVRRWRKKACIWFYLKPMKHSGGYQRLKLRNSGNDKDVFIHRLVAEAFPNGEGNQVNHIDGDKTNNHWSNLEWCNSQENASHARSPLATSKYAGVTYHKSRNKWRARLMVNGIRQHLGEFVCETAAHFAYLKALRLNRVKNKYA